MTSETSARESTTGQHSQSKLQLGLFATCCALTLGLYVIFPIVEQVFILGRLLELSFIAISLLALYAVSAPWWAFATAVSVGILNAVTIVVSGAPLTQFGSVPLLAMNSAYALLITVAITRDALLARHVRADRVFQAFYGFIWLGIFFAELFRIVYVLRPDSLAVPEAEAGALFQSFAYFSYVTLTTLGYGDVTPVGPVARNLAAVEALVGQVYLAGFIAWLVGLHATESRERGPKEHA